MASRMQLAYVEHEGKTAVVEAGRHYEITGLTGLKAGARCIQCGNPVALRHYVRKRRGAVVEDHFMHPKTSVCVDAVTCDAHRRSHGAVLEQIAKGRPMHCPAYGHYVPTTVVSEKSFNEIRPDLILSDDQGRLVLVEIFVTHRVPEAKRMLLRSYGIPTVEVDLSGTYRRDVSDQEIADAIYDDRSIREWIVSGESAEQEISLVGDAQRGGRIRPIIDFFERIGASIRYMVSFPWMSPKLVTVEPASGTEASEREILLALAQKELGLIGGSSSSDGGLRDHAEKKMKRSGRGKIPPSLLPCLFADVGMPLRRDERPRDLPLPALSKAA